MSDSSLLQPTGSGRPGPNRHRWREIGWGLALALLLLPLVAMQFTDEVQWRFGDFLVFGALLVIAGGLIELAVRWRADSAYRFGAALTVLGSFLLIWINLAVGIIASENDSANLMFAGVLAILFLGAALARGCATGMRNALLGAAVAQVAIAFVTPLLGYGHIPVISAAFTSVWLLAAWCFQRSARASSNPEN